MGPEEYGGVWGRKSMGPEECSEHTAADVSVREVCLTRQVTPGNDGVLA